MPIVLDARTVTDHFPGIGRYVVNLARALATVAPDLALALLYDPTARSTRLTLPELPGIACPLSPFSIQQQWVVPRQLDRARATLYHSPFYVMPYWSGVPSVFTCHDLIPLLWTQYYSAAQRLIFRLTHSLALGTSETTIAVSQATRNDLLRHFRCSPQRIVVIHEAADERFSPQPSQAITAVQHKHHLPDQYALCLASNKPHKNLVTLVQAWQKTMIRSRVSHIKLVIAGHWDNRYPQSAELAETLGLKDQVIFIGPVEEADLPALYSGATLFLFPSLYEGFGLPVLEAMACGAPVLCSNTSSLPEVAGDAAIQITPTNSEALAEAITQTLADQALRQYLRQKGMEQAAKFSWQRAAQETRLVYEAIGAR